MTFLSITFKAKHFFAFIKIKENKNFSYTKIIGGRRGRWEGLRKTDSAVASIERARGNSTNFSMREQQ